MTVLVTGGAGYIGSHTVHALVDAGERVVVLDNLSTGFATALPKQMLPIVGDVGDQALVASLIEDHGVESIIHFAGSTIVPESMTDPLSYYGHLSDELLRADRLVLDTGVHYKHWTREQMISYFREHSSQDEPSIQSETDRYISTPGQALAYKIGQLKILELRERARKELGDRFDIKAFHDEILGGGALPLDTLDARVTAWIAATKAKPSA